MHHILHHKKFSKDEAIRFLDKFADIIRMENLERVIGFIFSRGKKGRRAKNLQVY